VKVTYQEGKGVWREYETHLLEFTDTNKGNSETATVRFGIPRVDGETVETGSFNFTASGASRNAENVIVVYDRAVAQYAREWERLWAESEEMKARY
jgi:hypothetical protein